MRIQLSCRRWLSSAVLLKTFAITVIFMTSIPSAFATFPGANGHIAYEAFGPCGAAISLTDFVQPLTPCVNVGLLDFAWSPDGSQLAYIPGDASSIKIIQKDGSGEHTVITSNELVQAFPDIDVGGISGPHSLAWSTDGKSIAFTAPAHRLGDTNVILSVHTDGTGLREMADPYLYLDALDLDWSRNGEFVTTCNTFPESLCVSSNYFSVNKLTLRGLFGPARPKWTPDGSAILFIYRGQIYKVKRDLTGMVQITQPPTVACSQFSTSPSMVYNSLSPSPDGQWIVASGSKVVPVTDSNGNCAYQLQDPALSLLDANGRPQTLLVPGTNFLPAWQPIPQGLTVNILDGHNNPVKGLKVELRLGDGTISGDPINTVGGTYVFTTGLVAGTDYAIRATLIDNCGPNCTPAFDIRYAPNPNDEPVSMDWQFKATDAQSQSRTFDFIGEDPPDQPEDQQLLSYNIPSSAEDLLDNMAAIFFRTRQYVDWIRSHLAPTDVSTVHFYTFATVDPLRNTPVAPTQAYTFEPKDPSVPAFIVLGTGESDYQNRDPQAFPDAHHNHDAPQNAEWHEFTHHLYHKWVNNQAGCFTSIDHAGYLNPDTCNSMDEGFAEFLPTYAGQEILGPQSTVVRNDTDYVTVNSSTSLYDSSWDLRFPTKAWDYRSVNGYEQSMEELAVATLFWDLVAGNGNTGVPTFVIGADGNLHIVTYTNSAPNMSIQQLWTLLTSNNPATVYDVRKALGAPALSIDLDGDGVPDVAPIDIPFLMHGFYPIDDEQLQISRIANFYDVGYAQRHASDFPRNGFVGDSSHRTYNASLIESGHLFPRHNLPLGETSNIGITVRDAAGAPISGATAILKINYPGGQSTMIRQLGSGSVALVHLELPPYFDYSLPTGAPLPACNPATDVQVNVTISVVKNGTLSNETPSFNNCTYVHAVASATGPAALSFTLTIPIVAGSDTTPPTTTAAISPEPDGAGWNNSNVTVTLTAADNSNGSGVQQITYSAGGAQNIPSTVVSGATATIPISSEGRTTLTFFAIDTAGNAEPAQQLTIAIDRTAPSIQCSAPDGVWHAMDVSIACLATDTLSGMANSADSSFNLSTAVPDGTETANASTGSRAVCDAAGNCATAGPIAGNMVDKKPPSINVNAPNGTYLLNQPVSASYACSDGGSGVASCAGPVANGTNISTTSIGSNSFAVNATDNVGNSSTQSVTYTVAYKVCVLYDPTRSVQSGSTIPLRVQLCDFNNANASSSSVVVHAISLVQVGTNASEIIQSVGDANPDNDFRYDGGLGQPGGYTFNLSTKGLMTGTYVLSFTAGADPTAHQLTFQVR